MGRINDTIITAQDNGIDLPNLALTEQQRWFRKQLAYQRETRKRLQKYENG